MPKSIYRRQAAASSHPNPALGGLAIPGSLLRKLVKINAHYEGRGERIGGIATPNLDSETFKVTVTDGTRTLHLKLRLSADGVQEHGREEDFSS